MQIITNLPISTQQGAESSKRTLLPFLPTFLTIGNFDGLHRGHQALLRTVKQRAQQAGGRSAILTFDPHPIAVLRPEQSPKLLTTPQERIELAGEEGIDLGIILPFTRLTSELTPTDFILLLKTSLNMTTLIVGPDFVLGRNRSGDLATLRSLGQAFGYTVEVIEPIDWQGRSVRSSIIRTCIETGDVAEAAELLGRPYHVTGTVVQGDQRGRLLGFPTANLQPPAEKLLPAHGVYATYTRLDQVPGQPVYPSVTNLGVRPTVGGLQFRIEPHLLDFPAKPVGQTSDPSNSLEISSDLYGQQITVTFLQRLRGEQRFGSLEALKAQIASDIEQAKTIFHPSDSTL